MKVFRFVPVLLLAALVWLPFSQPALAQTSQPALAQTPACPNATILKENNAYNIPHEVELRGAEPTQKDFDCFSWQSLVALSWPATENENGVPDTDAEFGETGERGLVVWQTYKGWESVFPQNDEPNPCPNGTDNCWNTPLAGGEKLYMTSKSGGFLEGQVQAVPNAWLTDQNGQLTRYEILVNKDEFEFVIDNELYNGQIQKNYPNDINMPPGENEGPVGPIELKAAWKILTESDEPSEYFSTRAIIKDTKVNPDNGYPQPNGGVYMTCKGTDNGICQKPVGLVGFHIAHKVKGNPQWVWSTFEHKNNAPIQRKDQAPQVDEEVTYSYFNKDCGSGDKCKKNTNPRDIPIPVITPNQITRYLDPHYGVGKILPEAVNSQWQKLLAGTVWENYELISTQWPTDPKNESECKALKNLGINYYNTETKKTFWQGCPTPPILANTTMETYIQGDHVEPKYASSCIGCHQYGALLNGKKADFSYLFSRAKPN
ncbi:MAG: hypothetical protein QNJ36_04460 [Calothrix sp. MO_167.B42]|nr:hypothetical protein [Calothrix sp. MO_167.B42]